MTIKISTMPSALEATICRGFANGRRAAPRHRMRVQIAGGGGHRRTHALSLEAAQKQPWALSDDAKLFASTFAAGFLFVSILIA